MGRKGSLLKGEDFRKAEQYVIGNNFSTSY